MKYIRQYICILQSEQRVVMDGKSSNWVHVDSDITQRNVLRTIIIPTVQF